MPKDKSDLQLVIDRIEQEANKMGVGVFESNFDMDGERGEFHLIPMTSSGLALSPHQATSQCECKPKLLKESPKIYAHQKLSI